MSASIALFAKYFYKFWVISIFLFFRILKRVGGQWKGGQRKQVDGDKFVCLDLILDKDSCLIYSFGVARDWTFEDQMDNIGLSFTS